MIEINIDNDEFVIFTEKLESLSRSALPSAVRGTLNGLAFDVKKNTMPDEAGKAFVGRQKNFFKVSSRVNLARGSSIEQMESKVGFLKLGNSDAVENLEKQEHGGKIGGRSFIPTNDSRISKSKKRNVSRKNRIGTIKHIVKAKDKQSFVRSVHSAGKDGFVLYRNMLFRVNSISGRKFRLKAVHSFKKGRTVRVSATHFMQKATAKTINKGPEIFKKEAEFRFERHFR